jgi:hypothetical protein
MDYESSAFPQVEAGASRGLDSDAIWVITPCDLPKRIRTESQPPDRITPDVPRQLLSAYPQVAHAVKPLPWRMWNNSCILHRFGGIFTEQTFDAAAE